MVLDAMPRIRLDGQMEIHMESMLQGYLDAMPMGAYIKDLQGNFIYTNPKFQSSCTYFEKNAASEQTDLSAPLRPCAQSRLRKDGAPNCASNGVDAGNRKDSPATGNTHEAQFSIFNIAGVPVAIGGLVDFDTAFTVRQEVNHETPHNDAPSLKRKFNEVGNDEDQNIAADPFRNCELIFDNMPIGAALYEIIFDDDTGKPIDFLIRKVNPGFERLMGLNAQDIIDQRATKVFSGIETDPCNWLEKLGQVALTGENFEYERLYNKFLKRWYGGVSFKVFGKPGFVINLFLDNSSSIQAEEDLREYEERYRNLFETMMQGVVYQRADGSIIAANPSSERILGLSTSQMMGMTSVDPRWKSIKEDGTDFHGHEHPAMVALRTGKPVTGVYMGVYHPDSDEHHWIIIDSVPHFRPGEDKPFQVFSTFTDMTQTKEFERQLLDEKNRAEMADRLKSAFLANMSHEIRTPLNGMIGNIDLALANELAPEERTANLEGLHIARQSGELLIAIIQDILDLSKIEAGELAIEKNGNFNLVNLVEHIESLGETMINQRSKSIRFETCIDDTIQVDLHGDVFRLQQVLNNLVSNAIKFTDEGIVRLAISVVEESQLTFQVCDTGKGIPQEHLESIFEPFRQVEFGDTRKHGGTGLGLTISKKLVEMMGGKMTVESQVMKPNNGSCFRFTFPYRVYERKCEDVEVKSLKYVTEQLRTRRVDGKVLVAEDEPVSRRLVKRMLEISGHEVLLAENGEEAVEMFKTQSDIALILMDVQMPRLDGLAATAKIRQLESASKQTRRIPIIGLSAGAMKGDDERGFAVGMTEYLTKPVNFKLLQETLISHLGARRRGETR